MEAHQNLPKSVPAVFLPPAKPPCGWRPQSSFILLKNPHREPGRVADTLKFSPLFFSPLKPSVLRQPGPSPPAVLYSPGQNAISPTMSACYYCQRLLFFISLVQCCLYWIHPNVKHRFFNSSIVKEGFHSLLCTCLHCLNFYNENVCVD